MKIFILLYIKFVFTAGTTWLQEIIYLIANDLDFEKAKKKNITDRFPYLEWPSPGLKSIAKQAPPRLMKTHLPVSILFPERTAPKPKIISILRNPKDVLISYYYFSRMNTLIGFKDDLVRFYDIFLDNKIPYGPIYSHYIDILHLQKRTRSFENDVLILFYEDLQENFEREVDKVCDFLKKPRLGKEDMNNLKSHCSFEAMKNNKMVNYKHWDDLGLREKNESDFLRNGKVGDWKTHLSVQQDYRFNRWIDCNFNNLFKFKYEPNGSS